MTHSVGTDYNYRLALAVVIILIVVLYLKKQSKVPEKETDFYNIHNELQDQNLRSKEEPKTERYVTPSELVKTAMDRVTRQNRLEYLASPSRNGESPLESALHGGTATDHL